MDITLDEPPVSPENQRSRGIFVTAREKEDKKTLVQLYFEMYRLREVSGRGECVFVVCVCEMRDLLLT